MAALTRENAAVSELMSRMAVGQPAGVKYQDNDDRAGHTRNRGLPDGPLSSLSQ